MACNNIFVCAVHPRAIARCHFVGMQRYTETRCIEILCKQVARTFEFHSIFLLFFFFLSQMIYYHPSLPSLRGNVSGAYHRAAWAKNENRLHRAWIAIKSTEVEL